MPSFFNKLKGAFTSPSSQRKSQSQTPPTSARGAGGSTASISQPIIPQVYSNVKEKELPKLHAAAWRGDLDKVTELCRPDKLNIFDKDGRSALHLAIAANHFKVAEQLLTEDAKYQLDRESRSPLVVVSINLLLKLSMD
jgi:ankyrin repeat protein